MRSVAEASGLLYSEINQMKMLRELSAEWF